MKSLMLVGVCLLGILLSSNSGNAEVTVGQNSRSVFVEASETDCRVEDRLWDFLSAGERFSKLVIEIQQSFRGTPWEDLTDANEDEIRLTINRAITQFYEEQLRMQNRPAPVYGDPRFPQPSLLYGLDGLSWQHLKPSALFLTATIRLTGRGNAAATRTAGRAARAIAANARSPRTVASALANTNASISMQIGFVFAPRCSWQMPFDPSDVPPREQNRSDEISGHRYQNRVAAHMPGEFSRGWARNGVPNVTTWDMEPFVVVYGRGGVGLEQSSNESSRPWWQKLKPTIGLVWGDVDQARHVSGNFAAIGYDVGLRFGIPGTNRSINFGLNDKWGCINNPQKEGPFLPYCDDYVFKSWRFEPISGNANRGVWTLDSNAKVDMGFMYAGANGVRLLGTLMALSPEQTDMLIDKLSWIIDDDRRPGGHPTPATPPIAAPAAAPTAPAVAAAPSTSPAPAATVPAAVVTRPISLPPATTPTGRVPVDSRRAAE